MVALCPDLGASDNNQPQPVRTEMSVIPLTPYGTRHIAPPGSGAA
jgi:hypothetical protein